MVNMTLEWKHKEKKEDGTIKEHYLNIPVKLMNSCDSGYGYHGTLICNECNSKVEQFYICSSCGDKAKIGEILKRKDDKTDLIYEERQRTEFMKNEVDKTLKVVAEIDNIYEILGKKITRTEKLFEIYNNDEKVSPVIIKIYGYMLKNKKGLVCEFGYSNRGKSNKLGGILIAGNGELNLIQLKDYRLIRQPKQEGLPVPEQDETADILNKVSENTYPEMYEKFLELIKSGEQIEVTVKEKPKILVECDFLD